MPTITIITPCLNAASFAAEMAESVALQSGVVLEHLVMDGGSRDGTAEILSRFPHLRFIAAADQGSHDAMNKGLALAQGEIIGFLNTDDRYAPGLLAEIVQRFAAAPEIDTLLARSCVLTRQEGEWRVTARHPLCRGGGLDLDDLMYGIPCINARFFHRRVFERIGDFSHDFSFAADRHFLLRLALSGGRGETLDRLGYFYRSHDASRTLNQAGNRAGEIGEEHIAIAGALLATPGLARDARDALAGWRAYEELRAVLRAAQAGRWRDALGHAADLSMMDLPRGCAGKLATLTHRRRAQRAA